MRLLPFADRMQTMGDALRRFRGVLHDKPRTLLAATTGLAAIIGASAFLLTPRPSCAPAAQTTLNAELVLSARNHNCHYTLQVGQRFSIVSYRENPWPSFPPHLSDSSLVSDEGRSVGSPGPIWEFDYKAVRPGSLSLDGESITISIDH